MSRIKAVIVLPMLTSSGIALSQPRLAAAVAGNPGSAAARQEQNKVTKTMVREEVMLRQLRIERLLTALDRVAEAAGKMQPERAQALEPVVLDLAGQALNLTSERAVLNSATDEELEKLEKTVQRLMTVLSKHVEPEMSL
jgi:hypothetical protein